MTAKELEDKAWRLITSAKMAVNETRRKLLMKEAFELLARASVLRKSEYENEEAETGFSLGEQAYRMRLSNWDGAILWIYLLSKAAPTPYGPPMHYGRHARIALMTSTCGTASSIW